MTFQPCFLVPVYNHPRSVGTVVQHLARHALPIYVVDDGSDAETRGVLAELAAQQPLVRLIRLPVNSGKGAAVMAGARRAAADGLSHALQVDADGQHDLDDAPRFLQLGRDHPTAVVSGVPVYDTSVPRSRLYSRYLTHFWVWIETLSLRIGDSMCGFRLYPLAATLRVIDGASLARRMAFDIEIIVRLAWLGLPVINVPTRVTYPLDGVSHFRMLRDNLQISATHTKLVARMLYSFPLILWRRFHPLGATP